MVVKQLKFSLCDWKDIFFLHAYKRFPMSEILAEQESSILKSWQKLEDTI